MSNLYIIEEWWRHNGVWDREQASGIPVEDFDGETEIYLATTDEWWDGLTNDKKKEIYDEFFSEE